MINGINHITISVKNIDTAFLFYKNILKLKPVMKSNRSAYFLAGKIWIADQKENYVLSENYSHICFNVSKRHYKNFVEKIKENEIKEWQENKTEGDSLYIMDGSGNKLEIHFSGLKERIKYGKKYFGNETKWFI
ncbi:MAG: VOC family protein [Treponema sp.]|jgi:catechol 2,3-dioxygenase-like lactoylglutathione lyase family enzyme|nr:VOC family protein [Treponema sp.]